MAQLIDFELDAHTTILVEKAEDVAPEGMQRVAAGGAMAEQATKTFDAALAGIKPIARSIMAQMQEAVADAKEIQVEFGIKLTAGAGVILAKAAAEVTSSRAKREHACSGQEMIKRLLFNWIDTKSATPPISR